MLTCKSVLVSGANRGIGLEFVKQFLKLECPPVYIFAGCRNPDKAEDLLSIANTNSSVCIVLLDVTKQTTIDSAKAAVESKLAGEGLTLLINNAAVSKHMTLEQVTKEEMMRHYETNAVGPLMVTKTFLPLLKQSAASQPNKPLSCSKAGVIMISSSLASIGENSSGSRYPYRASKTALNMVTSNLSYDLKGAGILCTSIHPGWVLTDMGGPNAEIGKEESVQSMLRLIAELEGDAGTGKFYHGNRGHIIGW